MTNWNCRYPLALKATQGVDCQSGGPVGFETGSGRRPPASRSTISGSCSSQSTDILPMDAFRSQAESSLSSPLTSTVAVLDAGWPPTNAPLTHVHTKLNNAGGSNSRHHRSGADLCYRTAVRGPRKVEPLAPGVAARVIIANIIPEGGHYWLATAGGFAQPQPSLRANVASNFSTSIGLNYNRNHDDSQWFGNFVDGGGVLHHAFAELEQKTLGLTWRLNYTFTPTASLQLYANPFISKGTYSRVRELDDPRADAYDDRYMPYDNPAVSDDPGGFNFHSSAAIWVPGE